MVREGIPAHYFNGSTGGYITDVSRFSRLPKVRYLLTRLLQAGINGTKYMYLAVTTTLKAEEWKSVRRRANIVDNTLMAQ